MNWEVVIGLETHVQLTTVSKMFSGASTAFGQPPNTQACAIDLGLPGVLPTINQQAVFLALRFGLAVQGNIPPYSIFARKNYFYPDLPKGYQISQFEHPIIQGGGVTITTDQGQKIIALTRAHLEEDAGKSIHGILPGYTAIDLNRAGTPLLEIVTEPVMHSAKEAVQYAKTLHRLVTWLGICDGNLQEGSFRCDANVSVRRSGSLPLGTRCEIKNLNSFRFLEQAINYEIQRHIDILENGGTITQETRLFDPDQQETRSMRSKEDAMDYRYFPDPDLLPLSISEQWLKEAAESLPELPEACQQRWQNQYGLTTYDSEQLTQSKAMADYFERLAQAHPFLAKNYANWMLGDLSAMLNRTETTWEQCPISPETLESLIQRTEDGTLSNKMAKTVFEKLIQEGHSVDYWIESLGLKQISDPGTLEQLILKLIQEHPAQVAEYRSGKQKVFGFFVGQAMKASQGQANPAQLNTLLQKHLSEPS